MKNHQSHDCNAASLVASCLLLAFWPVFMDIFTPTTVKLNPGLVRFPCSVCLCQFA